MMAQTGLRGCLVFGSLAAVVAVSACSSVFYSRRPVLVANAVAPQVPNSGYVYFTDEGSESHLVDMAEITIDSHPRKCAGQCVLELSPGPHLLEFELGVWTGAYVGPRSDRRTVTIEAGHRYRYGPMFSNVSSTSTGRLTTVKGDVSIVFEDISDRCVVAE